MMRKMFDILTHIISGCKKSILCRQMMTMYVVITIALLSSVNYCKAYYDNDGVMAQMIVDAVNKSIEKRNISENYYSQQEKVEINPDVMKLVENADEEVWFQDVKDPLEALRDFTTIEGRRNYGEVKGWSDSKATDMLQRIRRRLDEAMQDGKISYNDSEAVWAEANRLYDIGSERALKSAELEGDDDRAARIRDGIKFTKVEVFADAGKCPSSDLIRAKYTSGCWSCLVVEKLTSSFLTAASKAYGLCQKAGKILLTLGAILWLAFWGLRNVSSLTQLEPGNILNELVKFAFKVALAYAFISGGLRFVGTYFINPIMGVGAKIAESFWAEDIDEYLDEYDWGEITEEDYAEMEQIEKSTEQQQESSAQPKEKSEEEKKAFEQAKDAQKSFFKDTIPDFIIPPVFAGALGSPTGCRLHPISNEWKPHYGLDIGGNNGAKIVAAGPGTLTYASQGVATKTGAGYYAKIVHDSKWTTKYFHMQPGCWNANKSKSRNKVVKGEVIGCVGTTGGSTGPHLHVEYWYSGNVDGKKVNCAVHPMHLMAGVIKCIEKDCSNKIESKYPHPFVKGSTVPNSPESAWTPSGEGVVDLTNFASGGTTSSYGDIITSIPNITYKGPTDILSSSVMNSILGATAAIGNITAENMVLGDVVMCYASLENGGAWNLWGDTYITNWVMWFEGMFFFCTGLLLSLATVFYLIDISFKIGFAVIALPIAVGLWPFKITEDKLGICISIIAKSAAIYAFMAIAVTYTVHLTDAVFSYEDGGTETQAEASVDSNAPKGLAKLYSVYDDTLGFRKDVDTEYATRKLALFSTTFVLILFAFLYSFKLVNATVTETVDKFFSDAAFGSQTPMHHVGRAFAGKIKDIAAAPAKWAGDVAFYQGGKMLKDGVGGLVDRAKGVAGHGSGNIKTLAGRGSRGAGNITKALGSVTSVLGKAANFVGMKKAGAKLQNAGNKINDFGKDIKSFGDALDKKANDRATRNKNKNDQGEK